MMVKDGDNNIKVVPFPSECKECSLDIKEEFGCGHDGFGGKSKIKYENGAKDEYWSRTCPMYAASHSFMNEIVYDLENYKRGAMGNIFDMDNIRFELLSIAENEQGVWENENQKQIIGK